MPMACELVAEIDGIVDAAVEAEAAERIVQMGGVAGEQHAAEMERAGDALVHAIGTFVADVVRAWLLEQRAPFDWVDNVAILRKTMPREIVRRAGDHE